MVFFPSLDPNHTISKSLLVRNWAWKNNYINNFWTFINGNKRRRIYYGLFSPPLKIRP